MTLPNDTQLFWMYLGIRQYLAADAVGREVTEKMIGALEDDTNDDPDDRELCLGTIREALFPQEPVEPEALK